MECGGVYAVLADDQTHCGLCVEAMTPEEYEATAMATADISRDEPHTRRRPYPTCMWTAPTRSTAARLVPTEYIVQDVGDDPDYLYDVDDLHGVPVDSR